jgi:hypothetical protein
MEEIFSSIELTNLGNFLKSFIISPGFAVSGQTAK